MKRKFIKISRPGDYFWCEVIEPFGAKAYKARVDNELCGTAIHGLEYNDVIIVKKSDVIEATAA